MCSWLIWFPLFVFEQVLDFLCCGCFGCLSSRLNLSCCWLLCDVLYYMFVAFLSFSFMLGNSVVFLHLSYGGYRVTFGLPLPTSFSNHQKCIPDYWAGVAILTLPLPTNTFEFGRLCRPIFHGQVDREKPTTPLGKPTLEAIYIYTYIYIHAHE